MSSIDDALVKEVKRLEKELAAAKEELAQLKVDYDDAEEEVKQFRKVGEQNTETFNKLNDMYNKVLKENVELKVEVEFHEKEIKELEKEIVSTKKESQSRLDSLSAQYKQIEDLKKEARTVIADTRAAIAKDFKSSPTVKKLEDDKKGLQARLDKVVENNITLKQENQAFRESKLKRKRRRLEKAEEKRNKMERLV